MGATNVCCNSTPATDGQYKFVASLTPRHFPIIENLDGKEETLISIQSVCRGYLARKDIKAENEADNTTKVIYREPAVEEIANRLDPYKDCDPRIEDLLAKGPERQQKHNRLIKDGRKEVGIYAGEWAKNDIN